MEHNTLISLVIPVFNEEEVLPISCKRMQEVMQNLGCAYEIIYVDDGSKDGTWAQLEDLCKTDSNVRALRFARNFGHQLAVTAGIDIAKGDAVVIIDADLQDPPEVIPEMVEKWREGYQVVYGKRAVRQGETFFKKFTASMYYRVLRSMSAYPIPLDTGDFRLIDKSVADVLRSMREQNRFLRGMAAWAGFKQCPVEYVRHERAAGKTHYTLKKMVALALNGILGFSNTPLVMPFYAGIILCFIACFGVLGTLIVQLVAHNTTPLIWIAWVGLLLFGKVFVVMGIQGAYLGRMYDEVRGRPLYIVAQELGTTRAKKVADYYKQ